jgi:hypothetical protein
MLDTSSIVGSHEVLQESIIMPPGVTVKVGGDPRAVKTGRICLLKGERAMAEKGVKRLPVVAPEDPTKIVGIVTLSDLLNSRMRLIEEEETRERFYGQRAPQPTAPKLRAD